jgi:hypothetical protein
MYIPPIAMKLVEEAIDKVSMPLDMYVVIEHNYGFVPVAKDGHVVGLACAEDVLRETIAEIVQVCLIA